MGCMQSTNANEQASTAPASTNAPAPASNSAAVAEPESEAAPKSVADAKFKINGVSITDVGVVFYVVEATDGSVSAKRRYNDFKALYAALGHAQGLPSLPQGGIHSAFRGKHSQELLQERELQFTAILNAIAAQPALAESAAFQKFLSE